MSRSSTKATARRVVRSDHRARILAARPVCEWPDCLAASTDVHEPHTRGRGGSELDASNAAALCSHHHAQVHGDPLFAAALGLLRSGGPSRRVDLTDKHHELRGWISDYERENGVGASVGVIVEAFGAGVHEYLGQLIDRGLIEAGAARTLKAVRR
jgi:hypothetical protein